MPPKPPLTDWKPAPATETVVEYVVSAWAVPWALVIVTRGAAWAGAARVTAVTATMPSRAISATARARGLIGSPGGRASARAGRRARRRPVGGPPRSGGGTRR